MMFMKLFRYIGMDENVDQAKIAMTRPVLMRVTPGNGWMQNAEVSMSFYLPEDFQGKAPAPTDNTVTIETMPETTVYVRSFGGNRMAMFYTFEDHMEELADSI